MLDFLTSPDITASTDAIMCADGQSISRVQLADAISRIHRFCNNAGISSSHRIGLLLENCWQSPVLTLALSEKCSVMPINPALTNHEITALAKEAGLSALLGSPNDPRLHTLAEILDCGLITSHLSSQTLELETHRTPIAPPETRPSGMVLLTSGTTGMPKRVPIRTDAMIRSARTIARTLQLGPQDRAVHALPMFHIGAVVDLFLAPLMAGGSIVIANGPSPDDLNQAVTQSGGTWIQLVPTMLARCVQDLDQSTRQQWSDRLRFIRSVSSDLSPHLHKASEAAFDNLPIIQMYGMSETAGQICSNPLPPLERRYGTVGPATEVDVQLLDPVGSPVPKGQEGEICVSGPTVTSGYEGVDNSANFWSKWLRTGDLGRFDEHGFLTLTGRVKEMINRGGEKISPLEIERCALELTGVTEAVAYAQPHPTLGEQVGLSLVLSESTPLTESDILEHLTSHLAEHKRPRSIDLRTSMPRLGSGKIDRLALAGQRSSTKSANTPKSALARGLSELWQTTLDCPPPHDSDDFFDSGGDSLQATTFLNAVEKLLGHPVDPNLLYDAPRFGALCKTLETRIGTDHATQEAPYLAYLRKQLSGWQGARLGSRKLIIAQNMMGTEAPVFVISQGEHTAILPHLNKERPAYLLRSLYGLKNKTDAITRDLAALYAEEIQEVHPDGPLFFIGYCEGAKLAHFIGDILRASGRKTDMIVSIDHSWGDVWHDPVLHVQSTDYTVFRQPELGVGHFTTGGADVMHLSGTHLAALHGPSMPALANRMERLFSGQEHLPTRVSTPEFSARHALRKARLEHKLPRLFKPGSTISCQIKVFNDSSADWHPTHRSGLSLTLDLHNLDGHRRSCLAGYSELHETLPAGQNTTLEMDVTFPDKRIPLQARISMTDEGICRFLNDQAHYAARLMWPFGRA